MEEQKQNEASEAPKEELKKAELPELKPGQTIRVHQQIKEVEMTEEKGKTKAKERKRVQIFEGVILKKSGTGQSATITVRKISNGVGVEKIFPVNLPTIVKIEPVKQAKVRKSKLYFLRSYGKRMKEVAA
ncbi:50S ribosomal protein L19 [Candidatus Falkowbacteria bacterium]|nr:50S ribosomal protein L19 [Candidatus Falkowbacteria bacterium]